MTPQERRDEFAKAALSGYTSSSQLRNIGSSRIAEWCVQDADALIAELDRTAPAPVAEHVSATPSKLCDALAEAMLHAFVPDMQDSNGNPYPFVDLMSGSDRTIAFGQQRIMDFAESLTELALEVLDGTGKDPT